MAIKRPHQCDTGNATGSRLWQSNLGQQILGLEATALAPFVRRLHGDSIVWVGEHAASAEMLQSCMVRNAIFLQQDQRGTPSQLTSLCGHLEALPFRSNSLDAVVLHHGLEQVQDPRVALREVTRVLAPGGRVLICGFNPMSLLGVRRLYARCIDDSMSSHRLVNPLRLFDWLTLLGFELNAKPLYCGYGLPSRRLVQRFDYPMLARREHAVEPSTTLPFGCLLVISAVKQAISLRPQWRPLKERRKLAPVAYPRVASWQRLKP